MPSSEKKIPGLFKKYLDNNITEKEHRLFWSLLNASENNLNEDLKALWTDARGKQIYLTTLQWDRKMRTRMLQSAGIAKQKRIGKSPGKTAKMAAIAFCLLVCLAIAGYFVYPQKSTGPQSHFRSVNTIHRAGYIGNSFKALI